VKRQSARSAGARLIHLPFQVGANIIRPAYLIRGKNRVFFKIGQQESKTSRTEKRARHKSWFAPNHQGRISVFERVIGGPIR